MALEFLLATGAALGGTALLGYIGGSIAHNVAKYVIYYDLFETEKVNLSDLNACDHIFIPGSISQGLKMKGLEGYYHHGVYLGLIDGKHMLTDFGAVNKDYPVIRELDEFLGGYTNQLYRRKYKIIRKRILAPEKTLKFAELICSKKHPWPTYSLNTNNCEHYASLLKMAEVYSEQVIHLPQDIIYRQFIVPNQGKSILRLYTDDDEI